MQATAAAIIINGKKDIFCGFRKGFPASANTCCRFVRIFGACSKRFCARRAIGHRHQPDGFSRGKKLVACFLKLVARISKSEPLIFSLLPCGVNTLKICFHFLALRNAVFPFRFSVARCLPSLPGPRGCAGAFCGPPAAGRSTKMLIFVSARLSPHVLCKNALTYFVLRTPFAIFATRQKVLPPKSYDK